MGVLAFTAPVVVAKHHLSTKRNPTFHRLPDWHAGQGWRGDVEEVNIYLGRPGMRMPSEVLTPCGHRVLFRVDASQSGSLGTNLKRMTPVMDELAVGHAAKIGSACRRCFPDGVTVRGQR